MAGKPENPEVKEEELTSDEEATLLSAFEKLGAKPKTKSASELKIWLAQIAEMSKQAEIKPHEDTNEPTVTQAPTDNTVTSNVTSTTTTSNVTSTVSASINVTSPSINTVASTSTTSSSSLPHYTPKLSTFFGEQGKGEATYDLWRYEVDSLRKSTFAPHIIDLIIRRSLRGDAAKVAMRLGPEATLDQLLNKLEGNYGLSIQHDRLMEEFYSAKQQANEDVTTWANRLEDLLYKASRQKLVRPEDINDKLCSMFWSGLNPKLRETSGHLHFMIKEFEKLKAAMREQEADFKQNMKPQPAKMITSYGDDNTQPELTSMVQQLIADVKELKQERDARYSNYPSYNNGNNSNFRGNNNRQYRGNNRRPNNFQRDNNRSNYQNQNQTAYGHQQQYNFNTQRQQQHYENQRQQGYSSNQNRQGFTNDGIPICWRCGQEGHKAYGCYVRLDNNRKAGLNSNRSALRGK